MESVSFERIVTWSMSAFTPLFQFERNNLAAMLRMCVVSMAWMACSMAPLMSQVFNLEDEAQQGINQYHEINVGVAETPFGWFDISPGFSVLIVHRKQEADSKLFFEYGYGGALPTIVTGKVGVGKVKRQSFCGGSCFPHPWICQIGDSFEYESGQNGVGPEL